MRHLDRLRNTTSILILAGALALGQTPPRDPADLTPEEVADQQNYDQPLRPQFHYTPIQGHIGDATGLIYYRGEYHLFNMYDEWSRKRLAHKRWGHAVSNDLIHWKQLPPLLDTLIDNKPGSGSGVVDWNDSSKLRKGPEKTLLIFYTDYKRGTCIAYSHDRGRAWVRYGNNPVIPGADDARDPTVFWYPPANEWRMVRYEKKGFAFYKSADLLHWTWLSRVEGYYECPDFFELPVVNAPGERRWVLIDGNGSYVLGKFDGREFVPLTGKLHVEYGRALYATQTWKRTMEAGRAYQIAWMRYPLSPPLTWNGQMSFPVELTLREFPEGVRLCREPIDELANLRLAQHTWKNLVVPAGGKTMPELHADLLDIRMEIKSAGASDFGLMIHGHAVRYSTADRTLRLDSTSASLQIPASGLRLRILVDRPSIEVFADRGQVTLSAITLENPNQDVTLVADGGEVMVVALEANRVGIDLARLGAHKVKQYSIFDAEPSLVEEDFNLQVRVRLRLQLCGSQDRFCRTPSDRGGTGCRRKRNSGNTEERTMSITIATNCPRPQLLTFLVLLTMAAWPCRGQESRATIVGRVTDSSSAVVPLASVRVTNQATGVTVTSETNEDGNYVATYLIPGTYRVECEKQGFKQYRHLGLELHVNDRVELNIALEVGNASETVTVSGETPLLETASASSGDVIEERRLSELPMPHGIVFWTMGLSPGLACVNCIQGNDSPFDSFSNSYTFAGSRAQLSELLIDGVPTSSTNNGPKELITSWMPPSDTVAELKVQTITYDASVGFTEGGATNATLKSGTNTLHGTAFFAIIPTSFVANTFFGNAIGQPRGSIIYHRWGGTVGGPIVIPHGYNGRNRTFFFGGYEGLRQNRVRGTVLTVPTAKERAGDFSDLLKLGGNYQIYDPLTRVAIAGGRYQESPIPGNIIPASRISPIATNILSYYSLPSVAGTANGTNNLPLPNATENAHYYTVMARVDHNISDRHRLFVRVNTMERNSVALDWFHNLSTARPFEFQSRGGIVDDVYTFSPTFIMNFHYGYDRFVRIYDSLPAGHGFDLTSLGFPASYNNEIPTDVRRFPYITISGYAATWNGWLDRPNDNHDFTLNFNKVVKSHALKFGPEFRVYRQNQYQPDNTSTGNLNFGTTYTQGPLDNSTASPLGQGLASMLLGIVTSGYVDVNASYAEQSTALALYLQDDWKVSRRLSVNMGLRWEYESPITERYNRSVVDFNPTATLPISGQVQAQYAANPTQGLDPSQFNVRGGLTFAGVNGASNGLWDSYKHSFMPRVGIAYTLNDKTVLRTGYGIYYGFLGTRRTNVIQTGFSQRTYLTPTLDGGLTFAATLANPFPNGVQQPLGATGGAMTGVGQAVSFFNQHPLPPYNQRWSFGIQRELPKHVVVDISYVGNRGTHIEINRNLDALPNSYLSTMPTRDTATINFLTANVANPFYPLFPNTALAGSVISRMSLLVPYPQFSSVTGTTYQGYSWYHSLEAKAEKRFGRGITLTGAYTYSKFMEATNYLNAADPMPERVISDQDFTHRISVSGIYELPFGKGRKFFSGAHPALNLLIGGWQAEGIFTGQTGAPLQWGDVLFNGDLHGIPLSGGDRSVNEWFNVDAGFVKSSSQQLSLNLRTFPLRLSNVRGPGISNFDLSAIKAAKFRERWTMQFRAEALNAFNHPLFANPNVDPTNNAFGVISAQNNNPRRIQLSLKLIF